MSDTQRMLDVANAAPTDGGDDRVKEAAMDAVVKIIWMLDEEPWEGDDTLAKIQTLLQRYGFRVGVELNPAHDE